MKKTFAWIPVDKIRIDRTYQRPVAQYQVDNIVNNLKEELLGTIAVSLRSDGFYYALDGQHRYFAVLKKGMAVMYAEVFENLNIEEEAATYVGRNKDTRRPEALDIFRAELVTKNPQALEIQKAVTECGLCIDFRARGAKLKEQNQNRPAKNIWAIYALKRVYSSVKANGLKEVLSLIVASFPEQGEALEADMIIGMHTFLLRYGKKYNKNDFINKMNNVSFKLLRSEAAYHSREGGTTMVNGYAKAMQSQYDKNKRNGRLEEKIAVTV